MLYAADAAFPATSTAVPSKLLIAQNSKMYVLHTLMKKISHRQLRPIVRELIPFVTL